MCSLNPFLPTVPTFAVRETEVSRHNGGTSGAPLKPLRDDIALRALSSLGQQMSNATVGINGLIPYGVRGVSSRLPLRRETRFLIACVSSLGELDRAKLHTEKSFRNLIKSNPEQIHFTIFLLIWNQMDTVHLVQNQSENYKYNLISVGFNNISKIFLCV